MRFSVGKKLWSGFLSVLLLMVVVGALGFGATSRVNESYRTMIEEEITKVVLLEKLSSVQYEISNGVRGYLLFNRDSFLENGEQLGITFDIQSEILEGMARTDTEHSLLGELKEARANYIEKMNVALSESKSVSSARTLKTASEAAVFQDIIMEKISALIELQDAQTQQVDSGIQNLMKGIFMFTAVLIGAAVVISMIVAVIISRSIARPVGKMTAALTEIANGNLVIEPVKIRNKDEIGDMATAFNGMAIDLRSIIKNAHESATQLAIQAEGLSASSEESLAASEMVAEISERNLAGSEAQVTIVNETGTAMEEMITGIDQITVDNEEMQRSTEDVVRLVEEGASLMEDVTGQMTVINTTIGESAGIMSELANYSEEIRKVTSLITDIAEQTNLLALNAAIEAARAGEHGKGFAVVAEEVRNLAEQSKGSTKEIGQMIDTMIMNVSHAVSSTDDGRRRVAEGFEVTERTRDVFNRIERAAGDVGEKVATVSAAIEQMRAMTDDVSSGSAKVQELAMTSSEEAQSTSAATEQQLAANQEISSSAQVLAELAENLQKDMGRFRV